ARLTLLADLREKVSIGSAEAVRDGHALALGAGLEHDPEVAPLLEALIQAHRSSVVFTPSRVPESGALRPPRTPAPRDEFPSYYMAPLVGKAAIGSRRAAGAEPDVVFALARGVLYALDASRGDVLWVRRVGVDTTLLPVRVPASLFGPELALILSSDN